MAIDPNLKHVHNALKQKFQGKKLIFGQGSVGSKIVFVAEIPGSDEDKSNKPVAGPSEKYLNKLLRSLGVDKRKVYITNVVKFFPSGHALTAKEIKAHLPFLKEEIKSVGPNIVVTLGTSALNGIGLRQPLDNIHGKTFNLGPYNLFPTFHPKHALQSEQIRNQLEADFVKLKEIINKPN
ncbi:MAG: Thermostable uracil-DNA glycosylase [Candidatus Yanofskybacteria bacterium GW2011_GWA1_44_21]|uniref:Uracil-DNA glycosylase-like domain-containing protein n=2 Tax=Candidatus Yanofskyibacteriota TaxID=1752733 RepID=A0A1F8H110_9BACT|nr:MAG: phage spo1 DNA polymerase-related protein [Microgenomates group bacterium GW2011_GWC1_43_11]KKT50660.1 MAG: Thermostable uracil-DNA glycosylase [Candidatus Yanofskybacteria bacterium GW2011_GWA1_44_21]KKT89814.1 MAG: Thermostable uracil-DNA glycosylase [Candidatus Yanofskybacteria bacterium GW2011_GWB1_45_11]OGN14797.1 MAG: hypothetical protein A3C01_00105 [Candidatus Yanofskybacteria bacterium RIFCSPHIGHO2_02_FULL_44_36b]OGN31337.1 MAG: hypothetical protein A3I96_00655 [Candidatus Yano